MSTLKGKRFNPCIGVGHSINFTDTWITSTPTGTLPVGGYSGYQFTYTITSSDVLKYNSLYNCIYRYRLYLTGRNENGLSNNLYFQTFKNDTPYHDSFGATAVATNNYWTTYVDVDGVASGDVIGVKLYASVSDMTITHSSAIILPNVLYLDRNPICIHNITMDTTSPTNGVNPATTTSGTYYYYLCVGTESLGLDAKVDRAGTWIFAYAAYPAAEGIHYSASPLGNGALVSATYSPYCLMTVWPTSILYKPVNIL